MVFAILTANQTICLLITNNLLSFRIELQHPPDARRYIPQMAERGGKMADLDVSIGPFPVLDALEKIAMMRWPIWFAAHFITRLVARAEQLPAVPFAENEHPLGAIERIAVLVTFLHVGRPDALLKDQLLLRFAFTGVFEDDRLRIGKLLVVIEEILSTNRRDSAWMSFDSKSPAPDVEVVHAVVA